MNSQQATNFDNLELFFEHDIVIKMFHFQTTRMAWHKSSDDYLVKYRANFDRLMEVYQGTLGLRLNNTQLNINIYCQDDNQILEYLKNSIAFFQEFKDIKEMEPIIDEMIADAYQFKYLLTFE